MFVRVSLCCSALTMLLGLSCGAAGAADNAQTGFAFQDKSGEYLDVLQDGKLVARYMYAYDKSTPQRREATYKPYLHVFDAEGKAPITKGQGGLFTHHRGIFIGWMKIGHNGKTYDRWHMKGGEIVHQKFTQRKADRDGAVFTSLTHWNDGAGKPILKEERTMTLRRGSSPFRLAIDFDSKLAAVNGDLTLDGDPEHSGVQFRPANEVATKETVYLYPRAEAKPHKDLDYPWVGETFGLRGKHYSVVELNHPGNPKGTKWSAYRDYGRFGAFPKTEIKSGRPLVLKYRFLIGEGDMPAAAEIQKRWDAFADVKTPTPTPETTLLPAERAAPKKKKGK